MAAVGGLVLAVVVCAGAAYALTRGDEDPRHEARDLASLGHGDREPQRLAGEVLEVRLG